MNTNPLLKFERLAKTTIISIIVDMLKSQKSNSISSSESEPEVMELEPVVELNQSLQEKLNEDIHDNENTTIRPKKRSARDIISKIKKK